MSSDENRIYGYRESYPRFFKANKVLQAKVGTGALDPAVLQKMQTYMDDFTADVDDLLRAQLEIAQTETANASSSAGYEPEQFLPKLANAIMQLKAIGSMFGHKTIGELAAVTLAFLDTAQRLDPDALEIVEAHNRAVNVVLNAGTQGINAATGMVLSSELQAAVVRYMQKNQAKQTAE